MDSSPVSGSVQGAPAYISAFSTADLLDVSAFAYAGFPDPNSDEYNPRSTSAAASLLTFRPTRDSLHLTLDILNELHASGEVLLTDITADTVLLDRNIDGAWFGVPEQYVFTVDPTHRYSLAMGVGADANYDWGEGRYRATMVAVPAPGAALLAFIGLTMVWGKFRFARRSAS